MLTRDKNHPTVVKFGTNADLVLGDSQMTKYYFFLNSRRRTDAILIKIVLAIG